MEKIALRLDIEGASQKRYDEVWDALDELGRDASFSFDIEGEILKFGGVTRVMLSIETDMDEDDLFDELDECGFRHDFSFTFVDEE